VDTEETLTQPLPSSDSHVVAGGGRGAPMDSVIEGAPPCPPIRTPPHTPLQRRQVISFSGFSSPTPARRTCALRHTSTSTGVRRCFPCAALVRSQRALCERTPWLQRSTVGRTPGWVCACGWGAGCVYATVWCEPPQRRKGGSLITQDRFGKKYQHIPPGRGGEGRSKTVAFASVGPLTAPLGDGQRSISIPAGGEFF
jgi:hypothetical protein